MRSKKVTKRPIKVDPIYKSKLVTRMVNSIMLSGKKSIAERIVYNAIDRLAEERKDAVVIFEKAIKNVMPQQQVRSRRVGGATYQVPMPLKHDRSEALAIRWLITASRNKSGKPMEEKLFTELKNASENMGEAIKKKEETHKMAEANRAFVHLRV